MKNISYVLALLAILISGCNGIGIRGSGIIKDENREIEEFDSAEINGAYEVIIKCGHKPSLEITGDDNIIPLVNTDVSGGRLHIWNEKSLSLKRKIRIKITTDDLNLLELSGASRVKVLEINNDEFTVDASGAVSVLLSGNTGDLNLNLSGAVNADADKLKAENVYADLSGASNADVYATELLKAEISGVGNIEYSGNPQEVKKRISGLGSITQR